MKSGSVSAILAGSGALNKTTAGTVTLSGANTYTGTTALSGGTLQIGNGGTTGTLGTGAVTDNATLAFNRTNSLTVNNAISGTGAVSQIGAGTTILTGGNSYAGTTTISAGTLQIGNAGTTGTLGTGGVTDNAALSFNRSNAISVSNIISGSGTVTQAGSSALTLSGNNSYAGATNVAAGTLSVATVGNSGSNSNTGSGSTINIGSAATAATLLYTGTGETSDKVINLNGTTGGATITQSGTGLLKFTSNLTATGSGAKTLTLQGSTAGTGEISGAIVDSTAATAVTKAGTGTWTLSGNNTYSGATNVNAGSLTLTNNSGLGSTTNGTTVAIGAVLGLDGTAGDLAIGAESLTLNGTGLAAAPAGALRNIAGNNSYAGAITLGSASTITSSAGTLTLAGGIGNGNKVLTIDGAGNTAITNAITGSGGGLTKTGSGTLTLGNGEAVANSYTGLTTVSAGELDLNKAAGTNAIVGTISLNGTGILKWLASNQVSDSSTINISGSGVLNFNGFNDTVGTLNLSGGSFNLNGATLTLSSFTNSGGIFTTGVGGHLTGTGATITWSGGTNTVNADAVVDDAHIIITGGTNTVQGLAGPPVGTTSGGVLKLDTGGAGLEMTGSTLTLNSDDTSPGKLLLDGDVTSHASATTSVIASGGANSIAGTVDLDGAARIFTIEDGGAAIDMSISAQITNGALTKAGLGLLDLSGANTYSGQTIVDDGTLGIGNNSALGIYTVDLQGGTIIATGGARSISNDVRITAGNGTIGGANNLTLNGTLLNFNSNRTLTVNNTAATTQAGGVYLSESNGTTRTLTINGSGNMTISGVIANNSGANTLASNLTYGGTGTLTLSGTAANTYTGTTTINSGEVDLNKTAGVNAIVGDITIGDGVGTDILKLLAANQIANTSDVTLNAAATPVLNLNDNSETIDALNSTNTAASVLLGSGTLTVGANDEVAANFHGVIGGTGGFIKTSIGTQILSGTNTYSGDTEVLAGDLRFDSGGTSNNSTIRLGATSGTDLAALTLGGANIAGNNVGSAIEVRSGSTGTKVMRQIDTTGTNTFSGAITLNDDLTLESATGGTLLFQGGSFDVKTNALTVDTRLYGSGALGTANNVNMQGTVTINEVLGSSSATGGSLVKDGSNTLILQGTSNNYTGTNAAALNSNGTTIRDGVLGIYGDGSLGLAPTTAADNIFFTNSTLTSPTNTPTLRDTANDVTLAATRNINIANTVTGTFDSNGHTFTVDGVINGSGGSITKIGAGTLVLNGNNTYGGMTVVNAGTLLVNGNQSTATGPVKVNNSGTTLGGTGTIGGPVMINAGANLSPGAPSSSTGILRTGSLTMASTSNYIVMPSPSEPNTIPPTSNHSATSTERLTRPPYSRSRSQRRRYGPSTPLRVSP